MFGQTFYYGSIKNYISVFGALFNDISIQRFDSNKNPIAGQLIKVPISFASKQKWLTRLLQDPNAGATENDGSPVQKQVEIQLPRIGFELGTLRYDPTRKLQSVNKVVAKVPNSNTGLNQVLNPVPYIFPFEMTIGAKNTEDIFQIVEQILPFFKPTFTVKISETTLLLHRDITTTLLTTVVPEITPFGDFKESKILLCTLNFEMYGFIYGPANVKKIITKTDLRIFGSTMFEQDNQDIEVYPFVDPTAPIPPDVEIIITPNPSNASPDSNFGFTQTKVEN